MNQEVRSVSIEPSAHEEKAPGWVVQNRPARYLAMMKTRSEGWRIVDMIFR